MARTHRRTKKVPSWVFEAYSNKELWNYHRDRGVSWIAPWSQSLKKEANSKRRSHAAQELAKWFKNPEHPVCLHRRYGNPWNWD